jgi:hypothetical protein
MNYEGGCHCGRVAFEVEGELMQVMDCNCSICSRKGSLLWFLPKEKLRLLTSEEELATYTFRTHAIKHRFCAKCGIHVFGESIGPGGNDMVAINVRCLENVDLTALTVHHFDGRSL